MAVVDQFGRVRGIAGLRVADASIMPDVICGNTNCTTIMLADRAAACLSPPGTGQERKRGRYQVIKDG